MRSHARTSSLASLAPSDSFSMGPLGTATSTPARTSTPSILGTATPSEGLAPYLHQPATRPAHYPREILWSLECSKDDEDVASSEGNQSRPAMGRVIRHADGTDITAGEYQAIKATAHALAYDLNQLPLGPAQRHLKGKSRTMRFYKQHMVRDWKQAIADAEEQQVLLTLCAAHWKAEHILGAALRASSARDNRKSLNVVTN